MTEKAFTTPVLECANCGRTNRHIYCWRLFEAIRLLLRRI